MLIRLKRLINSSNFRHLGTDWLCRLLLQASLWRRTGTAGNYKSFSFVDNSTSGDTLEPLEVDRHSGFQNIHYMHKLNSITMHIYFFR